MKELTKYSRLAGFLEKLYDKLNTDFFDGVLERPVITIQSSSRSYGHYTLYDAWSVKGEGYKEINIAAGTLNRPIEYTVCTLLHEMCHQYNNEIINIQDCSRGGTYHNKHFKQAAEAHSGQLINATLLHSFLHGIFTFENIHIIHDSCPKDNYIHTKINQYDTCDRYTIRGLECGCGGLWTKIKRASSTSGHDAATACTAHGCDEVCSFLL